MKFTAPADVSAIDLSMGSVPVVDGVVEIDGDLTENDINGLRSNGFVRLADDPAPAPAPAPATKAPPPPPTTTQAAADDAKA